MAANMLSVDADVAEMAGLVKLYSGLNWTPTDWA